MTNPTRRLTALSIVLAPVLLGAALLTDITPQAADTQELLLLIADQPAAWSMGQTLFFLSSVLWLPAGYALARLFRPGPRIGRVAAAAVAVGGLAVLAIDAAGLYLRHLAASDIPLDQQVALVESVEGSPTVLVFETIHVVGLVLGLLLLGVAMLRHRDLPRWAGAFVVAGTVGLAVAPGRAFLAAAVALLVVGLGMAAVASARAGAPLPDSASGGAPSGADLVGGHSTSAATTER